MDTFINVQYVDNQDEEAWFLFLQKFSNLEIPEYLRGLNGIF